MEEKEVQIFAAGEDEIVKIAMYNAYLIVTGKETFDSLISEQENVWLPFSPTKWNEDRDSVIENVQNTLEYFEKFERYELCTDLHAILISREKINELVKYINE